ncbi:trehalose-phosphatase [Erythrobacter alti]|uniref:trehalose-phosphatase n=1 Tax=Erythrobacter alti TaxID=1896145 RepID=UPI0030F49909
MTVHDLPPPPAPAELSADGPVAIFLDFDGTLVDIAPTPDSIQVPGDMATRLAALAARYDGRVALISGRAISDLERHLGPVTIACAGSHGSDCRSADGQPIGDTPDGLPDEVLREIADFAAANEVVREDKPHGAALHFRANPALEDKGVAFAKELAARHDLEVKRGKRVIELVARGDGKAGAVRAFMQTPQFAGARPIFVGDDVTDEDGMRAAVELGGFGVAVGERPSENAKYALARPAAVHHWLEL